MGDPVIVQEWQPLFVALAGASAALSGLVFVAMSLHPGVILTNRLTRARAMVASFGFLLGVAWALILLLPARTHPVGSVLLIVLGIGESIFVVYREIQARGTGMSVARIALGNLIVAVPVAAGLVGLLQPKSDIPFLLLAMAAGTGLFVLLSQAWTLVLHGMVNAPETQHQGFRQRNHSPRP